MGRYTIVLFFIFLLAAIFLAVIWIIVRHCGCFRTKFDRFYYNRDFSDEEHLKYYKKIPKTYFKIRQGLEPQPESINKTNIDELPTPQYKSPSISSSISNNIIPRINKGLFKNPNLHHPPKPDIGDIIKKQESLDEIENDIDDSIPGYINPNQPNIRFIDPRSKNKNEDIIAENKDDIDNYKTNDRPSTNQQDYLNSFARHPKPHKTQDVIIIQNNNRPKGMKDDLNSSLDKSKSNPFSKYSSSQNKINQFNLSPSHVF